MLHSFSTLQILQTDIDTAWKFMSSPKNLANITPSYMGFTIIGHEDQFTEMYSGQLIEYTVTPVLGLKMNWVTEITHVSEKQYFVDEQRFGPYAFWHHKHFLRAVDSGVEMIDIVHYKIPFGFLGKIANTLFIQKKLQEIFDYRYTALEAMFTIKSK
ncbi:MAG: cell division inhibitor [Flavobacteriales bacterium]|nr:MAG: cell division inhibitor [Flavobacteriales bacterium]